MATEGDASTIESILTRCLTKLKRIESRDMYLEMLHSEWYMTPADLWLAIDDGKAWSDLKLPGRLKIEIKRELQVLQSTSNETGQITKSSSNALPTTTITSKEIIVQEKQQWMKYFSEEHQTFFYTNLRTHESQWEIPIGDQHDIYDGSSSADVTPTSKSSTGMKIGGNGHDDDDDCNDDDNKKHEDEEAIWRELLRNVGTKTPTQAAEIVSDGIDVPSSSSTQKKSVIVVSDAYVIPEEVSLGVVETSMPSAARMLAMNLSSSERSDRSISNSASVDDDDEDDDDDDVDDPPSPPPIRHGTSRNREESSSPDPLMAQRLIDMGFTPSTVASALRRSDNNLSAAASILLANRRPSLTINQNSASSSQNPSTVSAARRAAARIGMPRFFPPPSAPPPPNYNGLR